MAQRIQSALARHYTEDAQARIEFTSKDIDPMMNSPAAFAAIIAGDVARLTAMAERLGIQPE